MKKRIFSLVGVVILIAMALHATAIPQASQANNGVKVQLAMILDGSGSINSTEWAIMIDGLAAAVENPDCVPQDGSVELTVVQFSTIARLEVGPVVITGANAGDVADEIEDILQMKDSTCISCGICLAADTLRASVNFDPEIKQALNLVTDGVPNRCSCIEGSCGYMGSHCGGFAAQDSAECARAYAIDELEMTADQDEFDAEGIGISDANRNWLRDYIVWPQPGYIAPPFDGGLGWVRVVEDFEEFAETICEKFEIVLFGSITAHKFHDLNGDGDQDDGEGNLEGWTMTLYEGYDCTGDEVASGTTDSNGDVAFTGLEAGTYSVKETLEGGWTNSTSLCQQVTIDVAESATLNFGNFEITSDIYVEKTASPTSGAASTDVTFTITVENTGDYTLDPVTVVDTLPAGMSYVSDDFGGTESPEGTITWDVGPLDSGDTVTIYLVAHIDGDVLGTLINSVTATGTPPEGDDVEYTATAEVNAYEADIYVEKTASPTSGAASTDVTFTITVENTCDYTLDPVTVVDTLPAGMSYVSDDSGGTESPEGTITWDVGPLDSGDTVTIHLVAHIDGDVLGTLINSVTATGTPLEGDDVEYTATAEVNAYEAGIEVEKTASPTSGAASTDVTFTITVENTCDYTLDPVTVVDTLPAGMSYVSDDSGGTESPEGTITWDIGPLDSGDTVTIHLVARIDGDVLGTLINSVTATGTPPEGEDVEASDSAEVTALPPPPPPGGFNCACCYDFDHLTVDWDGNNTTEPLYRNDKLAVDLLGPNPDGSHNLLLERGTHAPTVYGKTHYLIIVRELKDIPPLPENIIAIVVFNVTPVDAVFDEDIFLTLGFDQLPENALNATIAYYDDVDGVWVPVESEAGGPNGVAELTLSAAINHFSIFGVLVEVAPPAPAHFVPSGLNIEPTVENVWETVTFVTRTGKSVTITANVVNDGGQGGTYVVELKLNGEAVDTKILTLGAGQSEQVSFTVSGLDYGQYEVEVAGLSDEFTTSRTITWWLVIGLIIWVIVILAVLAWGIRRRRRKATVQGEEG